MRAGAPRSLRATRWIARVPRLALVSACIALAAAGLRSILASTPAPGTPPAPAVVRDAQVESFAESFARAFLTWKGATPADLDRFGDVDPATTPAKVTQRVLWTTVAGMERTGTDRWTATVAAQTTRGDYDIAVTVQRSPRGLLAVSGPPALVGDAPTDRRSRPRIERDLDDQALAAVIRRSLRNYLAGDHDDLVADLTADAVVVLPNQRLAVSFFDSLTWAQPSRRAAAVIRARSPEGVEMTLRYELAVVRVAGRWLVRAIHTNPTSEVRS